ncbi:MAG: molecular chaperone TorD family protein [Deltaproteobacteria bacterium]|nr:molecular chaperone TorD family protein [Deltaproteobacteria bacterium]
MNETTAQQYKLLSFCFHKPQGPLFSALRETEPFRDSLRDAGEETLLSEYTRLLSLTVAGGIPPYETEYGHKDIFYKTGRLADIAGFYRAFGLEISDHVRERVDFIGAELDLMYWLTKKEEVAREQEKSEEAQICRDAAAKFLEAHLGRWGSYFGDQLAQSASLPFYRLIGKWLCEFIESECGRLGVRPERVTGWNPEPLSATEFGCGADPSY